MAAHAGHAGYALLTACFSCAPGLKAGAVDAAMSIASPVCGFRPWRAARSRVSNVPKPGRVTLSPELSAVVMESRTAFRALSAWAALRPDASATASRSSLLFMAAPSRMLAWPLDGAGHSARWGPALARRRAHGARLPTEPPAGEQYPKPKALINAGV